MPLPLIPPALMAALKFIGLNLGGGALSAIPFMMMSSGQPAPEEQDPFKQFAGTERQYQTGKKGVGLYAPVR
jgi:hypothetical protein